LYKFVEYASPRWSVVPDGKVRSELYSFAFFNYNSVALRIRDGVAVLKEPLGLASERTEFHVCPTPNLDANRIDIIVTQVGGGLQALVLTDELPAYRRAMKMTDFSPHLTKHYRIIGERWLEGGEPRATGAAILELATLYGLVTTEAGGVYRLARKIEARRTPDGQQLWGNYKPGHQVGPRGQEKVVAFLENDTKKDGQKLLAALKDLVYADMEQAADGAGWDTVKDKIGELAGSLRSKAREDTSRDQLVRLWERTVETLEALQRDIERLKGREKPALFR
jgi:hypothetical protein